MDDFRDMPWIVWLAIGGVAIAVGAPSWMAWPWAITFLWLWVKAA
jgi:hypothetical protein